MVNIKAYLSTKFNEVCLIETDLPPFFQKHNPSFNPMIFPKNNLNLTSQLICRFVGYIINEKFLVGIKLICSINLKCLELLLYDLRHRRFHSSSSHCWISESSVLRMYHGISTHSPRRQRRKPLSTGYSSVYSEIMAYAIQWEWGNVEITFKPLRVWVFPFIISTWTIPIFVPPPLQGWFLLTLISIHLDMTFNQLGKLIITRWDE